MKYLSIVSLMVLVAWLLSACEPQPRNIVERAHDETPDLVIGIIFDQMRPDFVFRYWNHFQDDGFRRLVNDGFTFRNAFYRHMPTATGPGHAAQLTGTTPSVHGLIGNSWYVRELNRSINVIEDVGSGYEGVGTGQASVPDEVKVSLDGEWQFKLDPYNEGIGKQWYSMDVGACGWEDMQVPGNWDLRNEYAEYGGVAWYRKSFEADESWHGQAVRLIFESVYNDAEVWLNGKLIGDNQIGYLPFWFDIQDNIHLDESNTIALRVDNTFKRGAIWNWGGIRRPVWLEITDPKRLELQHITAVPDLDTGTANVDVEFGFSNQHDRDMEVGYEVIVSKNDEVIWKTDSDKRTNHIRISAGDIVSHKISFELPEQHVELWHFNSPQLYNSQIKLYRDDNEIHSLTDRFGIRKIEVDGETFRLNGEAVRTVGFNLVAEDRTTGNTLPLWRIKEDVDLMKSLGANMARLSHKPLPKAFLDYLDERGIMVFEEVSAWQKDPLVDPENPFSRDWLERLIELRYNHPSIIGWSVGNEIGWHHHNPEVNEYVKRATDRARELDPHRLAIYVSSSADVQETDAVQYCDMILFTSYGNWGQRAEWINENHPGKPVFIAEYNDHLNDEDLNEAFIDFEGILGEYRGRPYVTGASIWTFNDYRSLWKAGETWTTPPSQNRPWGVVDVFRQKKRPFFDLQREYAPVETFLVEQVQDNQAEIHLMPRNPLDIPAYTMQDYTFVWSVTDEKSGIREGGIHALPVIDPGDDPLSKNISWESTGIQKLRADLLDPQHYSVRDTIIYFSPPQAPEIVDVQSASNRMRVVFTHVDYGTSYQVFYGKDDFSKKTEPTINDYVEIEDLERFGSYQLKVVALNNSGQSNPSTPVRAQLDRDELPPVIRKSVPSDGSFFVGYSVDRTDYMYQVEYGTVPGNFTNRITARTFGVLQVPGLEDGKTYYYRIRSRRQDGFDSNWSHEVAVTPDGGLPPDLPVVHGVIRQNDRAYIRVNPVEKAVGYQVSVLKDGQQVNHIFDNRSHINYIHVGDLSAGQDYTFVVNAQNKHGLSEPVYVE